MTFEKWIQKDEGETYCELALKQLLIGICEISINRLRKLNKHSLNQDLKLVSQKRKKTFPNCEIITLSHWKRSMQIIIYEEGYQNACSTVTCSGRLSIISRCFESHFIRLVSKTNIYVPNKN
jgi:hypothetical protein